MIRPPWRNVVRLVWDGRLWSAVAGVDPVRGFVSSAATPGECLRRVAAEFDSHRLHPDPRLTPEDLGFTSERT